MGGATIHPENIRRALRLLRGEIKMKARQCTICGNEVPEKRLRVDAITCSAECSAKNARLLGWVLEQAARRGFPDATP